jgi:3-deoxy-D-manno-octulosonate 8-phosphate phosphatase (KDO 8-P phosphatase)
MPQEEERERSLAGARLLALDVDGTLTDGQVVYGESGEIQRFSVHDGAALRWLLEAGVLVVWITGRGCAATERRAQELEITELVQKSGPKDAALADVQERLRVGPGATIAMGDDLPDLGLRARASFFAAPANARPEVRAVADLVTAARGGEGAVRELCELVLRAKGRWSAIVSAAER